MLDALQWRYATKKYDATKKLTSEQLNFLKEAVRLSASSYGLQGYKVLVIQDAELREKLQPAAWNQPQITDASALFVFCIPTNYSSDDVNTFVQHTADERGLDWEVLKGYAEFMNTKIFEKSPEEIENWLSRQVYIALGNLLAAAGSAQIDATPIEGFEPEKFDEILGLKEKNLRSVVLATVGFRHEEDATQHYKKVRKPAEQLFEEI